ncbi:MAG: glycosyltransferase [Roseburia sp.]
MLSVCIIAKNEEQNIARCLECIKPTGLEIVVVDTGSTDRTREISCAYTEKVYDFTWCDDFAAAKNYAISKATNPYVMIIDSDEFIERIDLNELYGQLAAHPDEVGRIRRRNLYCRQGVRQENREWINRIFARERFCYEGRIHEQVTAKTGEAYDTYQTSVVISHSGYDLSLEERKKKAKRNEMLLRQELAQLEEKLQSGEAQKAKAEAQMPYILYQLGKSCYMAEEYGDACDYFSRGLSYDLEPRLEYVIDMVETYGYALLNSGQAEMALLFESIYDAFGDSADFDFLMGLIYMNNERFGEAIAQFGKAAAYSECRNAGTNSYAAYYNIGVIYECLGQIPQAVDAYKKCGAYEPAEKRLALLQ